jgi:condensin complex subunit 2
VSQYQPNDDDDDQVIPLKHVNDEIAEKRSLKRRKSQRMTMAFDSGDASQGSQNVEQDAPVGTEGPKTPKKTALARANQIRSVAVPAPMVPVPLEIMTSNFEEWMKMATDNVSLI